MKRRASSSHAGTNDNGTIVYDQGLADRANDVLTQRTQGQLDPELEFVLWQHSSPEGDDSESSNEPLSLFNAHLLALATQQQRIRPRGAIVALTKEQGDAMARIVHTFYQHLHRDDAEAPSHEVDVYTFEELEQEMRTVVSSEVLHALLDHGATTETTHQLVPMSFGHNRSSNEIIQSPKEDAYMKRMVFDRCQRELGCYCLDSSVAWPRASAPLLSMKEGAQGCYAHGYDYMVVLDLPATLAQLHATNLLFAARRWCVLRMPSPEKASMNRIIYALCMSTARSWNPDGNTLPFKLGITERTFAPEQFQRYGVCFNPDPFVECGSLVQGEGQPPKRHATTSIASVYFTSRRRAGQSKAAAGTQSLMNRYIQDTEPDIRRCYIFSHKMPHPWHTREAQVFQSRGEMRVRFKKLFECSADPCRFSLVLKTMVTDTDRFVTPSTLILSSHEQSIAAFGGNVRFLNNVYIVAVTRECKMYWVGQPSRWNREDCPYAIRVTGSEPQTHVSLMRAFSDMSRIIVADAFVMLACNGQLLRSIRKHSPNAVVTWVCYTDSAEETMLRQLMLLTDKHRLPDKYTLMAETITKHQIPRPSSSTTPLWYDEERTAYFRRSLHGDPTSAPYISPLYPVRDAMTINERLLSLYGYISSSSQPRLYRVACGQNRGNWVALPYLLLNALFDRVELIHTRLTKQRDAQIAAMDVAIFDLRVALCENSQHRTHRISPRNQWKRVYEIRPIKATYNADRARLVDLVQQRRALIARTDFTPHEFAEMSGPLYVEQAMLVNEPTPHIDVDPQRRYALDLALMQVLRVWRHHIMGSHMPNHERQLEFMTQLRADPTRIHHNTLYLLATACDDASPFDCSQYPGEIALMTRDCGLLGYTRPELVYDTLLQIARDATGQRFLDFAPDYAYEQVFQEINQHLEDRQITPTTRRQEGGWYRYHLEPIINEAAAVEDDQHPYMIAAAATAASSSSSSIVNDE